MHDRIGLTPCGFLILFFQGQKLYTVCSTRKVACHHVLLICAAEMGVLGQIGEISVELNVKNSPDIGVFAHGVVDGRYDLKILSETAHV